MFHLKLLGSAELARADGEQVLTLLSQPKRLALLAYLAADPSRHHTRDDLIGVFWPESTEHDARNALKQALHYLRRSLTEGVVVSRGDGRIEVDREFLECDVVVFEESVASRELEVALKLYGGDLAEGLYVTGCPEFDHWRDQRSATLRRTAVEAAETLARRRAEGGNLPAAVEFARRSVALAPSDESQVRALMRYLADCGDRGGAIAAYDQFERRFRDDLGLEPSPETVELLLDVREGPAAGAAAEVALATDVVADAPARPPAPEPRPVSPATGQFAATAAASPRRWIGFATAVALIGVAAVVGVTSWRGGASAVDADLPRLIVLPFANLSDSADDYFAAGMTEEITASLAGLSGLRVIARQTAIQYAGSPLSAGEIARELGVDYVLEGTIRRDRGPGGGGQVRITPQLIRGTDETHVWAGRYTVELVVGDIFRIQAEIATRVAVGMDVVMPQSEAEWIATAGTESAEAYDFYMRGRSYFERDRRRLEDFRRAAEMFERAVVADPTYVEGYAMLARTYSELGASMNFSQADAGPKAREAAERALELGPDHPDAHLAMGVYYTRISGPPDLAEQHFQAARRARPRDTYILQRLANSQGALGDRDAAQATREEALELDPRSIPIIRHMAVSHMRAGRWAEAVSFYDRYIALRPDGPTPYFWQTLAYLFWDGSTDRARMVVEAAAGRADLVSWTLVSWDFDDAFLLRLFADHFDDAIQRRAMEGADPAAYYFAKGDAAGRSQRATEAAAYYDSASVVLEGRLDRSEFLDRTTRNLALAYAHLGNVDRARALAAETRLRQETVAQVYMLIGDHDAAVDLLEELQGVRRIVSVPMLRIDPLWDPMRSHPGFQALLADDQT